MIARLRFVGAVFVLLLSVGCGASLKKGNERWQKFRDIEPEQRLAADLAISTDRGEYEPEASFRITIDGPNQHFLYVLLMLPNNDVYLIAPSARLPRHLGPRLELFPREGEREFFAPALAGEYFLGVIASEQNVSLLSEGWLRAEGAREFDTWPAERPFDDALEFLTQALDDKPWSFASSSFTVKRPEN